MEPNEDSGADAGRPDETRHALLEVHDSSLNFKAPGQKCAKAFKEESV